MARTCMRVAMCVCARARERACVLAQVRRPRKRDGCDDLRHCGGRERVAVDELSDQVRPAPTGWIHTQRT